MRPHQCHAIIVVALLCALPLSSAWPATDYSALNNDELAAKRGTMRNATDAERQAFHEEWQKRIQQMSPDERRQAVTTSDNGPRDGSGQKGGRGKGGGMMMGRGGRP
ncbi:MAG: hypothetical protein ACOY3Z_07215 [Thermodesulfobacteriota bacterium]